MSENFTSFILGKFFTACGSCAVSNAVNNDRCSKGFTWVLWTHRLGRIYYLFSIRAHFHSSESIKLTTFKEVVNRSDLQDTLHIFVQDANLRLSIRVDDKFCKKSNSESFIQWSVCVAHERMNLNTKVSLMHLFSRYLFWWGHPGPTA